MSAAKAVTAIKAASGAGPGSAPMTMSSAASTAVTKPIPALYTVYVLRSTMRRASLYIGSTPDPPRRLKQHNGETKGGAVRTSRPSLRPWEMVALVSGFPGSVAALKFEWALTNPHLSLHIPAAARLSVARTKKKNGHPRRPPASMQSIVANLHLLLGVPSFTRWPLRLHVRAPEVQAAWDAWCAAANQPPPPTLELVTEYGSPAGIRAMPVDYTPLRDYVDKARDIFAFERARDCAVCREALCASGDGHGDDHGHGHGPSALHAVCPNTKCEAVGHLRCWSAHLLSQEAASLPPPASESDDDDLDRQPLVPVRGRCPECRGPVVWADMMKELTLRLRAPKEVDKLVKAKRKQEKAEAAAATAAADAAAQSDLDSVVEIDSDAGSTKSRARKAPAATAKAKTAKAKTAATAAKTTKTATKTKTAKTSTKTKAAADNTKITKTARVTKRKDASAKKMDAVVVL